MAQHTGTSTKFDCFVPSKCMSKFESCISTPVSWICSLSKPKANCSVVSMISSKFILSQRAFRSISNGFCEVSPSWLTSCELAWSIDVILPLVAWFGCLVLSSITTYAIAFSSASARSIRLTKLWIFRTNHH